MNIHFQILNFYKKTKLPYDFYYSTSIHVNATKTKYNLVSNKLINIIKNY